MPVNQGLVGGIGAGLSGAADAFTQAYNAKTQRNATQMQNAIQERQSKSQVLSTLGSVAQQVNPDFAIQYGKKLGLIAPDDASAQPGQVAPSEAAGLLGAGNSASGLVPPPSGQGSNPNPANVVGVNRPGYLKTLDENAVLAREKGVINLSNPDGSPKLNPDGTRATKQVPRAGYAQNDVESQEKDNIAHTYDDSVGIARKTAAIYNSARVAYKHPSAANDNVLIGEYGAAISASGAGSSVGEREAQQKLAAGKIEQWKNEMQKAKNGQLSDSTRDMLMQSLNDIMVGRAEAAKSVLASAPVQERIKRNNLSPNVAVFPELEQAHAAALKPLHESGPEINIPEEAIDKYMKLYPQVGDRNTARRIMINNVKKAQASAK